MSQSRYRLGKMLDPSLLERVERVFEGENLVETILHAHLLIERAITKAISEKLARPEVLEQGQWSFYQKLSLYIGLADPPADRIKRLRGFNKLRNAIAHRLQDDPETAVARYLPWDKERETDRDIPRPEALLHVRIIASMILMFDLDAVSGMYREPVDWEDIGPLMDNLREKRTPDSSN